MKGINVLAAFLGGTVLGAACGILFAPDKGENTRTKIADALKKKGIHLKDQEIDELVDDISEELKK